MTQEQEKLVTDNTRMAYSVAKRYESCGIEFDDLVSLGYLGLVKAAQKFNPSYGFVFSTFAYKAMNNEILQQIRRNKKNPWPVVSMNETAYRGNDGSELTIEDSLVDETSEFDGRLADSLACKELLDSLGEKERFVVTRRIGIGAEIMKQADIANKLGISQASVSRLYERSLKKLRQIEKELGIT